MKNGLSTSDRLVGTSVKSAMLVQKVRYQRLVWVWGRSRLRVLPAFLQVHIAVVRRVLATARDIGNYRLFFLVYVCWCRVGGLFKELEIDARMLYSDFPIVNLGTERTTVVLDPQQPGIEGTDHLQIMWRVTRVRRHSFRAWYHFDRVAFH